MNFKTNYTRIPTDGESNNGEILVETAGYITTQKRIENIINAGMRLQQARKEQFDFPAGTEVDESFIDPTRKPGYDMADASIALKHLRLVKPVKDDPEAPQGASGEVSEDSEEESVEENETA